MVEGGILVATAMAFRLISGLLSKFGDRGLWAGLVRRCGRKDLW